MATSFNVDLPPLPSLQGLKVEEVTVKMEDYLKQLTISLEEMFIRVHKRGQAVKNTIEVDSEEIQLVNDESAPGNSKYYGTDGAGAKGWHALP